MSVVGNIVPRDMMALVKAFAAGKIDEAQKWHRKLFPLCRDMLSVATNPIPVKAAMKLLGRGTGEMRLPMCPLDAAGEAKVRQTLVRIWAVEGLIHTCNRKGPHAQRQASTHAVPRGRLLESEPR